MTELVTLAREDSIATLTLNRPDKKNAINQALLDALRDKLLEIRDDMGIEVLILTGAGGVFSSGIDHSLLMEVLQKSREVPFRHLHRDLQEVLHMLEHMERPVICQASGYCVGLGLELALACDFRFVTEDCVLGLPEVAFGIIPDVGGTTRLVQTAGRQVARELILTGKLVTGRLGAKMGLVTDATADAETLETQVQSLAKRLCCLPAPAIGLAKTMILRSASMDDRSSFQLEGLVQSILLSRPEIGANFLQAVEFLKAQFQNPEDVRP